MENRYKALVEAHKKANPSMKAQLQLKDAQKLWNDLKKDPEGYDRNMLELKTKASKLKAKNLGFWTNYGKSTSNCESSKKSNDETTRPSDAFPSTSKTSREIETTETVS